MANKVFFKKKLSLAVVVSVISAVLFFGCANLPSSGNSGTGVLEPEIGKVYVKLGKNRTTTPDKNGQCYGVYLYEVYDSDQSGLVSYGSKYIKTYPSGMFFIYTDDLEDAGYGELITFTGVDNLFGECYEANPNTWINNVTVYDDVKKRNVSYKVKSWRFDGKVTDELLEKYEIEKDAKTGWLIYKKINEPETGKRYIKLNQNKEPKALSENGWCSVWLYEICSQEEAYTVKYNQYYIRSYPSGGFWLETDNPGIIGYGNEITFTDINSMFTGLEPDKENVGRGWTTFDSKIKRYVDHKMKTWSYYKK